MRWRVKRQPKSTDADALRMRALALLAELSTRDDGDFVPAHRVSSRLGYAPGLATTLEELLASGLTERGNSRQGGWGDRPTEAGYAELDQFRRER